MFLVLCYLLGMKLMRGYSILDLVLALVFALLAFLLANLGGEVLQIITVKELLEGKKLHLPLTRSIL